MLQHGSILVEDDQPLVSAIWRTTRSPSPQPAATLTGSLGRTPAVDEVAAALFDAVRSLECPDAAECACDESVELDARARSDRYT